MSEISLAELEDKDVIYIIGIGSDVKPSVHEWFLSEEFDEHWNETFDKAEYFPIPAKLDEVEIEGIDVRKIDDVASRVTLNEENPR